MDVLPSWFPAVLLVILGIVIVVAWMRVRRRRSMAHLLVSDTKKTMAAVRRLPEATQYAIATDILHEIELSLREIENTPGPRSSARDMVIRHQIARAQALRHQALQNGASDWSDPEWATASIFESWLMANSGTFGEATFLEIDGLIMAWLREAIGRQPGEST